MWVLDRVLLRHLFMILGQQESRPLEERIQPGSFALDIQKDSCCPCKVPEKADGFTSPGTGTGLLVANADFMRCTFGKSSADMLCKAHHSPAFPFGVLVGLAALCGPVAASMQRCRIRMWDL